MNKPFAFAATFALLLTGCADTSTPLSSVSEPAPIAREGAVSSADPRADAAGEAILAQGGSATDAAIAVMLRHWRRRLYAARQ